MGPAGEPIEAVFREERGRLLALLAARFGDLDLADEVTAEALLAAVETWPRTGVPRVPLAWLATTARRKALDRIRRDATLAAKLAILHAGLPELLLVLHELLDRGCSAARRLEHALAFAETHDQQHVLHASLPFVRWFETPSRRMETRAIDTRNAEIW